MFVIRRGLKYWSGLPQMPWTWAPAVAAKFESINAALDQPLPVDEKRESAIEPAPSGKW